MDQPRSMKVVNIGENRRGLPSPNAYVGKSIRSSDAMLPIFGQPVGGKHGEFVMNGSVVGEVRAPAGLSADDGAYCLYVLGDSMADRYYDGEIVYVDPHRRPKNGDFVVAQIRREPGGPIEAFIKRMVRRDTEELVLEQLNPKETLTFPHTQVHAVHFIVYGGAVP